MKRWIILLVAAAVMLGSFSHCSRPKTRFSLLCDYRFKPLAPLLQPFADKNGIALDIHYRAGFDLSAQVSSPSLPIDALWTASSPSLSLAGPGHKFQHTVSIMHSPLAFGIKKSLAKELGFLDHPPAIKDILQAIQAQKLSFLVPSITRSHTGLVAYIAFIQALSTSSPPLCPADLDDPELGKQIQDLFSGIKRSAPSEEKLLEIFFKGKYDAIINRQSLLVKANRKLTQLGQPPLALFSPVPGNFVLDCPLALMQTKDKGREEIFFKLREFLLSPPVQEKIRQHGWEPGLPSPPAMIPAQVLQKALARYRLDWRKPSLTVFCLDFSASMQGQGIKDLKQAAAVLFDPQASQQALLQACPRDITIVLPFNTQVLHKWKVKGNDPEKLFLLLQDILDASPAGGTDIYTPILEALKILSSQPLEKYLPAIILFTDGVSNVGKTFYDVKAAYKALGKDIPIFCLRYGQASEYQLNQLARLSKALVLDGREDLIKAFLLARSAN